MIRRWETRQVGDGTRLDYPINYRFFLKCNAVRRAKHNNQVVQRMASTKKKVYYKYIVVDRLTGDVLK